MTDCKHIKHLIEQYGDPYFSRQDLEDIQHHIFQCDECKADFEAAQKLHNLFESHNPKNDSFGESFDKQLHHRLVEENQKPEKSLFNLIITYTPVFVTATIVLFLFVTVLQSYLFEREEQLDTFSLRQPEKYQEQPAVVKKAQKDKKSVIKQHAAEEKLERKKDLTRKRVVKRRKRVKRKEADKRRSVRRKKRARRKAETPKMRALRSSQRGSAIKKKVKKPSSREQVKQKSVPVKQFLHRVPRKMASHSIKFKKATKPSAEMEDEHIAADSYNRMPKAEKAPKPSREKRDKALDVSLSVASDKAVSGKVTILLPDELSFKDNPNPRKKTFKQLFKEGANLIKFKVYASQPGSYKVRISITIGNKTKTYTATVSTEKTKKSIK